MELNRTGDERSWGRSAAVPGVFPSPRSERPQSCRWKRGSAITIGQRRDRLLDATMRRRGRLLGATTWRCVIAIDGQRRDLRSGGRSRAPRGRGSAASSPSTTASRPIGSTHIFTCSSTPPRRNTCFASPAGSSALLAESRRFSVRVKQAYRDAVDDARDGTAPQPPVPLRPPPASGSALRPESAKGPCRSATRRCRWRARSSAS